MMDPVPCCAVSFDFEAKELDEIDPMGVGEAMEAGRFVWVDVDATNRDLADSVLTTLGLVDPEIVEDALSGEAATQHGRYVNCLHLVLTGGDLEGTHFRLQRLDAIMGEQYLVTIHTGPVRFLQQMNREYKADFVRYARSPSFLLYELWDHLIDNYLAVQHELEGHVEQLQKELIGTIDETIFTRVSELGADLLHFRKVLQPARTVLTELATRKSVFVSEATQPYLANMVGTVERVLQDLLVDRDILSQTLNLHMSMVSHRTNEAVKRLTGVSIIFLPLTFLCGIYGMNFKGMPELGWEQGYIFFWLTVVFIVGFQLWLLRRKNML